MAKPAARVVIEDVRPQVDCGRLAAKAAVGVPLEVSATVFADGPDLLLAWLRHGQVAPPPTTAAARAGTRSAAARTGTRSIAAAGSRSGVPAPIADVVEELPLQLVANDRWAASFVPTTMGHWGFEIVAVPDDYGSWLRDLGLRFTAGQAVEVELEEGALLAERRTKRGDVAAADRRALQQLASALREPGETGPRVNAAGAGATVALMRRTVDRAAATHAGPLPLWVDRERAAFSAWYELFPRSEGATAKRSGSLTTAAKRLPGVAAMGFDTVYLPPIHPIGTAHRKGRNNSLTPAPDDPGSPWAIGGPDGGHTAIHTDLGTIADFRAFVRAASDAGLEVAMDYALQCSPDHPWVTEHPEWFRHRPDGSIRYAENPPKRYQDIFPINFDTADHVALWNALRDVLVYWIDNGVRIFRVDNPHTKPIAYWEWVIAEIHREHPDVLFLAEAFTRPAVMHRLAKVGFSQSYTYFTWRTTKDELTEYFTELASSETVDYFRPNFWVNTPDILPELLQHGGAGAFRLRLVLAALAGPSWGMYSGYELYEHEPVREGSEEYLDSEKYQIRVRTWDDPRSLAPLITVVNGIRRRHRDAVAQLSTLRMHRIDNDSMICFSRMSHDRSDVVLVVVNLDPFTVQEATTWVDLTAIGLDSDTRFRVHDELTDTTYSWRGPANYVRLDPSVQPAHILHVRT